MLRFLVLFSLAAGACACSATNNTGCPSQPASCVQPYGKVTGSSFSFSPLGTAGPPDAAADCSGQTNWTSDSQGTTGTFMVLCSDTNTTIRFQFALDDPRTWSVGARTIDGSASAAQATMFGGRSQCQLRSMKGPIATITVEQASG